MLTDDFPSITPELDEPADPAPQHRLLWINVLALYYADLKAHHRWLSYQYGIDPAEDRGEAWRDFRSPDRPILRYLCGLLGYDADAVRGRINARLL